MNQRDDSSDRLQSTDHGFNLERRTGQRIHAFSNMITGHFYQRTERPFGINLPEWRVLRAVLHTPGISQAEIASAEGLNVMNVSRAVAGLRRKGLLEVNPDPDDRRRTRLSATDTGHEIGVDIVARERLIYEHIFSVLAPGEVEELGKVLDRVNAHLREDDLPPPPEPSRDWAEVIQDHLDRG